MSRANLILTSVGIVCCTVLGLALISCFKVKVKSAPERVTSAERVMQQALILPEHNTSTERMQSNQLATVKEQMTEAQKRVNNYQLYKAELASSWKAKLEELKGQGKTDQLSTSLAFNELKFGLQAKYGVTDSEPTIPTYTPAVPQQRSPLVSSGFRNRLVRPPVRMPYRNR